MMPRPTTTSAAATTSTKNTAVCPPMSPSCVARATKREVDGVEHQLDAHEHHERVAPHEHADGADAEQHGGEHEVPRRGGRDVGDHASHLRRIGSRRGSSARQQHRADDGDDQQHRRELEGEHVVAEQVRGRAGGCWRRGRRSRVGDVEPMPAAGVTDRRGRRRWRRSTRPTRPTPTIAASGRWIGNGSIAQVLGLVDTEQHDHEQEQHDDRAGVDDHLHGGEEVRLLRDEQHGDAEQGEHEAERGVHRVAADDRHRPRRRAPSPTRRRRRTAPSVPIRALRSAFVLRRLGGADAVAELAAPADLALEVGIARRRRRPHPPTGRAVLAVAPVLPRQVLRLAVVVDDAARSWCRSRRARLVKQNSNSFVSVIASVGHASTQRSQWMQRR